MATCSELFFIGAKILTEVIIYCSFIWLGPGRHPRRDLCNFSPSPVLFTIFQLVALLCSCVDTTLHADKLSSAESSLSVGQQWPTVPPGFSQSGI